MMINPEYQEGSLYYRYYGFITVYEEALNQLSDKKLHEAMGIINNNILTNKHLKMFLHINIKCYSNTASFFNEVSFEEFINTFLIDVKGIYGSETNLLSADSSYWSVEDYNHHHHCPRDVYLRLFRYWSKRFKPIWSRKKAELLLKKDDQN